MTIYETEVERNLHLARQATARGSLDQATEHLRQALTIDPDHANAHSLLALCLHDQRRLHASEHEALLAMALEPDSPLAIYALGHIRIAQRNFLEARELFEQALAIDPTNSSAHRSLATALDLTGKKDEALSHLQKALQLAPEDPDILEDLSDSALDRGDLELAERRATTALKLEPGHPGALLAMGRLLLRRDHLDEAREHAVWVLRNNATHRGALHLMASIKAKESRILGLWWRFATWMGELGNSKSIAVLLGAFVTYRVLSQVLTDMGYPEAASLSQVLWFGLCAYTWFAPAMFQRQVQKEIATVVLDSDF